MYSPAPELIASTGTTTGPPTIRDDFGGLGQRVKRGRVGEHRVDLGRCLEEVPGAGQGAIVAFGSRRTTCVWEAHRT